MCIETKESSYDRFAPGVMSGFMGMGMRPGPAKPVSAPAAAESWRCECGADNTGKFCRECGSKRPEKLITCECGYQSTGKYCPECGKRLAADTSAGVKETALKKESSVGWTCRNCGRKYQTGDKCENCGEEIEKVILFSCSSYKSTNPPQSQRGQCRTWRIL